MSTEESPLPTKIAEIGAAQEDLLQSDHSFERHIFIENYQYILQRFPNVGNGGAKLGVEH